MTKKATKKKTAKKKTIKKPPGESGVIVRREWLNKRDMARSCGISVQAFDRWGVEPVARLHQYGTAFFTVSDVLQNRLAWQANKIAQATPNLEEDDLDRAKDEADLEFTRERAEGHRLRNAQMRKQLAPIEMVAWAISKVLSEIAAQLETIPGKIKRARPEITTGELQIIQREVAKAQNTAADNTSLDWDEFDADFADPEGD